MKRDEAAAHIVEGNDPNVVKKTEDRSRIGSCAIDLRKGRARVARKCEASMALVHADDVIRSLEQDVFPIVGDLPIAQLTPPLILSVLREIEARGAIETAKRVRQRISSAFVYGIAQDIVKGDSAEKLGAVLKPVRNGRQPAIADLLPLRKMMIAAEEDYARPTTRLALRLLALTDESPRELRGAEWCEFEDLNGREPLWRIPTARMKGDLDRKEQLNSDHLAIVMI